MAEQRTLRVLHVTHAAYPQIGGGVDRVIADLLRVQPANCSAQLLRVSTWHLCRVAHEFIDGTEIHSLILPLPPRQRWRVDGWLRFLLLAPVALLRLRRLLQRAAIDVVHLHTLQHYQLYFTVVRKFRGPPYLVTLHRGEVRAYPGRSCWTRASWRRVLRGAATVTAVSASLTASARATFPFLARIETVANGIVLPIGTLPDAATVRAALALPARYCVMAGRLQAYKGHDVGIRAWAALGARFPELDLVVVGDGDLRAQYRDLTLQLKLQNRVHFTGQLDSATTLAVMRESCAVIMPSRDEGFGLVVLEAGALGVPVIVSDLPVFREFVEANVCGLMFAVDDHAAVARAVTALYESAALRATLVRCFSARIAARYDFQLTAAAYATCYRRVLADGHADAGTGTGR